MAKRLSAQDWIDFAMATLAREGFDALKADVLARKLGVSRGSFYWHFTGLDDFHRKIIDRWKQLATDSIIVEIERFEAPEQRLNALLRIAFEGGSGLEPRMRAWADNNIAAAQAVSAIDRRRQEYIERLLVEAEVPQPTAKTRAQLLYWTYLGAVS
ncbi:TetR/AcrR family transcriptional regulator, partial [uncultured Nitratireductor sp.]|uniref:TetR/AcrR family transcriptional regulator n=1 Tax=uncultured Nitratireductor sp. TaxID=520953 RepID=UPI0025CF4569